MTRVEVFDPASNTWDHSKPNTSIHQAWGHTLVVLNGELHALGGHAQNQVDKYDAQANAWVNVPAMTMPLHQFGDPDGVARNEGMAACCSTNSDL